MIEIGRRRTASILAHRLSTAFGTMAVLLLLIWLVRGVLTISQYSTEILVASFALGMLGLAFNTRTRSGPARAVSSFLGNITGGLILVVILIWFLGWVASIQGSPLSSAISGRVTDLVIAAIATGLLAYVVHALTPARERFHVGGPAILVHANSSVSTGRTTLSPKADTVALPITRSRSGRTVGCVVFGDIKASFDTPMGNVTASFTKPVTTAGIPFRGEKAGKDEVTKITGESVDKLIQRARVDDAISKLDAAGSSVDLPFIHVREDPFGDSVDVGPISIRDTSEGGTVKIGPLEFNMKDGADRHTSWLRGAQDSSYLMMSDEGASAKWNGSSLWVKGDSMKLTAGTDGFHYSPTEVKTFSPLHTLHVANQRMTLNTRKFTLNVAADRVVLRAESGSKSTDSADLARDLRNVFTEEAKKHIQDVMKGAPIDLDDMLSSTEEVLKKYD
ncbi:MAG: hypothetical protein ACLQEQ_01095 [Nitrososphaerales archaeon]